MKENKIHDPSKNNKKSPPEIFLSRLYLFISSKWTSKIINRMSLATS